MDPSILGEMFGMNPRQQMELLNRAKDDADMLPLVLENVCTTLVMGFEEYLRGFDAQRGMSQFVEIGQRHVDGNGDVATYTLRCIANVLEHVPNSNAAALANPGVMQTAVSILKSAEGLLYGCTSMANCVEEALRVVNFVAIEDPKGTVASSGIITTIVDVSKHLDSRSIKLCIESVTNVCRKMVLSPSDITAINAVAKKGGGEGKKGAGADGKKGDSKKPPSAAAVAPPQLLAVGKPGSLPHELGTKLIPHLQSVLTNAVATAVVGDQWPTIESAARCMGVLADRLASNAKPLLRCLVTAEVVDSLFEAITSVAQLESKKAEVLNVVVQLAAAAPGVVWKQLLSHNALKYFDAILQIGGSGGSTDLVSLLDDPFGSGSTADGRGSANNRTGGGGSGSGGGGGSGGSAAQNLLLTLSLQLISNCIDALPTEFFAVPFSILPVHKWSWEDDVHSYMDYPHDQCVAVEGARFRKEKSAQVNSGGNTYTIDFSTMKQSRGERARNVRRADVPYAFEILSLPPSGDGSSLMGPCAIGDLPVAYTLKIAAPFLARYAPLVIKRASVGANDITALQAAIVVAQSVHACLPADDDYFGAISAFDTDIAEFVSELLNSATDEVVDVGLVLCDLLFHHGGHEWGFAAHCRRFGIIGKIESIAGRTGTDGESARLKARAAFLAEVIGKAQSPTTASPTLRSTPLGAALNLFVNASGDFQDAYIGDLLQNLLEAKQLTALEFEGLDVAQALLKYLTKAPSQHRPASQSASSSPVLTSKDKGLTTPEKSPFDTASNRSPPPSPAEEAANSSFGGTPAKQQSQQPQQHGSSHNPLNDAPPDPRRVRKFVQQIEQNAGCMEVLVKHLIAILAAHHRGEPDVECLTTQRSVRCRSLPDALNMLAAMSPTCDLCSNRPKDDLPGAPPPPPPKPVELQPHETCPGGHRLVEHVSASWSCDVCGGHGVKSMACRPCNFDICMECFENPEESGYAGAPYCGSPEGAGGGASGLRGRLTHILSTAGDIEKGLSTGGPRGGNMARQLSGVRGELEAMLMSLHQRVAGRGGGSAGGPLEHIQELLARRARDVDERMAEAERCDAAAINTSPDRAQLFYEGVGRLAYQEPLFGVLYRKAFTRKIIPALEALETCIMQLEASPDGTGKRRSKGIAGASPSARQLREFSTSSPTRQRTLYMHVFSDASAPKCACGELARESYEHDLPPLLQRRACTVSSRPEFSLLHLLFQINEKNGGTLVDPKLFVSQELTSKILRSAHASALRVALMPPEYALPRWANNVLFENQYLVPVEVRLKLMQFVTFGARKALWAAVQRLGVPSPFGSFEIQPAEWQGGSAVSRGRLPTKHKVHRGDALLKEAESLLKFGAELRNPIVVEIDGEAGTGLGPTVQFFTMVATELCRAKHDLWRAAAVSTEADALVVEPPEGLFPKPRQQNATLPENAVRLLSTAGMALARAMLDGRVFPLPLSAMLFEFLRSVRDVPQCFADHVEVEALVVRHVDAALSRVLDDCFDMATTFRRRPNPEEDETQLETRRREIAAKFEAMDLLFTLPGHDDIELVPGGAEKAVTAQNAADFVTATTTALLINTVQPAVAAFLRGFMDTLPTSGLRFLTPVELQRAMCGVGPNAGPLWTAAEMSHCLVANHGYSKDSPQLAMLVDVISNAFTPPQQSAFLAFCTGCPRLPLGGIKALGHITVVRKELPSGQSNSAESASPAGSATLGSTASGAFETAAAAAAGGGGGDSAMAASLDMGLPSVNTCFRYLKLPPYPNSEMMRAKLLLAIQESGDTFELS